MSLESGVWSPPPVPLALDSTKRGLDPLLPLLLIQRLVTWDRERERLTIFTGESSKESVQPTDYCRILISPGLLQLQDFL
ncbi:MAG: hypothetical protein DDT29_02554 [Dehalococcoidia bacterium]|nr:hypothetical protein [Bacillota bacterium]